MLVKFRDDDDSWLVGISVCCMPVCVKEENLKGGEIQVSR
jgi:hypothetical protein